MPRCTTFHTSSKPASTSIAPSSICTMKPMPMTAAHLPSAGHSPRRFHST